MAPIAWIIFLALTVISLIHFYWALGGVWPGHDERSLAQTVVGATNISRMPPNWLSGLVAICIFFTGLVPLMWSAQISYSIPQGMVWFAMWALMVIFLGRGIVGFTPFFRKSNSEQPFARLNTIYFSPLCILIGAGFASLIYLSGV